MAHRRLRYVAYLRRSVDQTGEALGVEAQRELILLWAATQGVTITEWYCDNGITASRDDVVRPDYDRMIADIRDGADVPMVVVVEASRLNREETAVAAFSKLMRTAGGAVVAIDVAGGETVYDLSTTAGRVAFRDKATDAVNESEQISDRMYRWHARKRAAHEWSGGGRPYGWRRTVALSPDGRKIVITWVVDEDHAAIIREIARRLAAGEATGKICSDLNGRGVAGPGTTKHDHESTLWSMTSVRYIMRNPRLAGWYAEQGPDGVWSRVARSGTFPPILSDVEFDAVQVGLDAASRRRTTGTPVRRLLSGVVVCSVCQSKLRLIAASESWFRYNHAPLTMARKRTRKDCAGPTSIDGPELETHVRLAVTAYLARRSWERPEDTPAGLVERRAAQERRLDELAMKVASEEVTLELAGRTERIILAAIEEIDGKIRAQRRVRQSLTGPEAARVWAEADVKTPEGLTAARKVLTDVVDRIEITPGKQGNKPFDVTRVRIRWVNEEEETA
ncbi:recombinase family protein [Frankia sp. CNm7]|uniref:Recombinase family protein n=1 Tax=Frankia nepalensis TaxID=1836974 RepID=A0A937RCV7_9ACTN|nr:recombinase family protein [Frankia nepalensis]MBL7494862.1 recombinase family protein [Frankia nepalensis]MBL7512216.1 recombinase family protein [Frankia nepalensis]MBL7518207.1 recombinase family protein [Frankia nepalensis]MBL7626569.1 recombinase family protein [Frankia nepalensis]